MSSPIREDYWEQSEDEGLADLDADYERQWELFLLDCKERGVKATIKDWVIFREERSYP